MNLKSDNKLITYHSWFACPLLDLQADSCTHLRNGGASLMPPCYLYLDLPKHDMRSVSRFCLWAHTLAVKSSIWQWKWPLWLVLKCSSSKWGACSFPLSRLVCVLSQKEVLVLSLPFLPVLSCGAPLYFACLA